MSGEKPTCPFAAGAPIPVMKNPMLAKPGAGPELDGFNFVMQSCPKDNRCEMWSASYKGCLIKGGFQAMIDMNERYQTASRQ